MEQLEIPIESCEQFRKINKCDVSVNMERDYLFKNSYPNLIFVDTYDKKDFDKVYTLTWKDEPNGRSCSLQNKAANILGIPFDSKKFNSKIDYKKSKRPDDILPGKYVCISTQSTAQSKF